EVISREMIERIAAVEGGLEEETTYDGRKLRWSEEARKGLWTMKNAYQRRRVKARVEKRARMMKLDTITLEFARQVIEDETGTPLDIKIPSSNAASAQAGEAAKGADSTGTETKLIARDERNNPLISTFEWTNDAAQRILRVPAGFMRNKTQERIEELARERAATTIDLALVEEGIEIGKKMMAEMIASYSAPGASPGASTANRASASAPATGNGGGYLNEVGPLTARSGSDEHR
ncbi:MAG TPA: PCP reductase family protein, partial [Gemmatimonadales bacterium]|nr:PCP reductase family protein [Gemmatimonadales bacterium]